jgi:hypothetical protein
MKETVAEAPHVAQLTKADFLVDEDDLVEETVEEAPLAAHLSKADFFVEKTTE